MKTCKDCWKFPCCMPERHNDNENTDASNCNYYDNSRTSDHNNKPLPASLIPGRPLNNLINKDHLVELAIDGLEAKLRIKDLEITQMREENNALRKTCNELDHKVVLFAQKEWDSLVANMPFDVPVPSPVQFSCGTDHWRFCGDRQGYKREKGTMAVKLSAGGHLVCAECFDEIKLRVERPFYKANNAHAKICQRRRICGTCKKHIERGENIVWDSRKSSADSGAVHHEKCAPKDKIRDQKPAK